MKHLLLASKNKRFLAYLLDVLPITGLVFLFFYVFRGFDKTWKKHREDRTDVMNRIDFMLTRKKIRNTSLYVWLIYGALADGSRFQGTFGKHLMGIKVTDMAGQPLTKAASVKRNLGKFLSIKVLLLGLLSILFDKKKQAWHDKIAQTIVVESKKV